MNIQIIQNSNFKSIKGKKRLTALLARILTFLIGMKEVRFASIPAPIGQTECGSNPKTVLTNNKGQLS